MKLSGKITKTDAERKQIFGWASVANDESGAAIVDSQGDTIAIEELEKAAYDFVLNNRTCGEMHETEGVATLIESMVFTPEKLKLLGLDGQVNQGWWVGFQVTSDEVWAKIKSGEYKMFSIGGRAVRG